MRRRLPLSWSSQDWKRSERKIRIAMSPSLGPKSKEATWWDRIGALIKGLGGLWIIDKLRESNWGSLMSPWCGLVLLDMSWRRQLAPPIFLHVCVTVLKMREPCYFWISFHFMLFPFLARHWARVSTESNKLVYPLNFLCDLCLSTELTNSSIPYHLNDWLLDSAIWVGPCWAWLYGDWQFHKSRNWAFLQLGHILFPNPKLNLCLGLFLELGSHRDNIARESEDIWGQVYSLMNYGLFSLRFFF
jgi:hypothetical protein